MARADDLLLDPAPLAGWRLLGDFRARLERLACDFPLHPSFTDARRKLQVSDYLSLFLFGLLNPTVRVLRGLSAASKIQRVQEEVCRRFVSLASFSDTQHLLDPELLHTLLAELGADRAAGVVRDGWATLGSRKKYRSRRVRVVEVQTPKCLIRLVTDGAPERLSAELVAQMYRQRWEVELFFRWIKCTLGCRHWLAESQRGVTIQVYLALIAAVLLQLYVGQRPNQRMMELIQLYLSGIARLDELERLLAEELARVRRARERAKKA